MSRWKAAAIHLSINALIALLAALLIFGVWYPQPYSQAAGADGLIVLLLGVDLVLGPMLTLVVFKAGKWGLKFDLALIAIVQASAFVYGLHVVAAARPAFVVANVDRFSLVAANDIDPADFAKASRPEFSHAPWTGPRIIGAALPTDVNERNALVLSSTRGGKDIDVLPQYYVDYASVAKDILQRAKPLDALYKENPDAQAPIQAWLHSHQRSADSVRCVPLTARRATLTILLDKDSGTLLDALPIAPW